MQSLPAIETVEKQLGLPVISAATSTVYQLLKNLGLETMVPNAGSFLSGKY
jgi:maleate isomerase